MEQVRLTGLLIVKNGERLLDQCLESISFCDRLVIIDSGSTDRTREIAEKHGALFIHHDWPGFPEQVQYGIDWLADNAPSEWIFSVDCDEVCTRELMGLILAALDRQDDVQVFSVKRKTWYLDRYLLHGGLYPDRLFRLFKSGYLTMSEYNGHLIYSPQGSTDALNGDLLHFTYAGFADQMGKMNNFLDGAARYLTVKGKKGGLARALGHSCWRFFSMYFLKLGFLDGKAGFIFASYAAFYAYAKYLRVNQGDWGAHVYNSKDFY